MSRAERVPFQCLPAAEAAELIRKEREIRIFDVRDMPSYQQAHVEGAMQLTEDRVPLWVGKIARTTPVLIYCYHGNASQTFAQMFSDFRFQRVYSVDGGYRPLADALAGIPETEGA
ncbi:thiosulfate sulfurtransferase GlpE [Thauera sedimentorum]|uniref:thiosulfate sulfurtransferase GlpE n=1 Tax=Thauera sedimentorum TaxID=2767595 RepID=UPI001CA6588B|nr:thiosulfate sulfurtransferase GlpE [Thauera sedimentorum]